MQRSPSQNPPGNVNLNRVVPPTGWHTTTLQEAIQFRFFIELKGRAGRSCNQALHLHGVLMCLNALGTWPPLCVPCGVSSSATAPRRLEHGRLTCSAACGSSNHVAASCRLHQVQLCSQVSGTPRVLLCFPDNHEVFVCVGWLKKPHAMHSSKQISAGYAKRGRSYQFFLAGAQAKSFQNVRELWRQQAWQGRHLSTLMSKSIVQ